MARLDKVEPGPSIFDDNPYEGGSGSGFPPDFTEEFAQVEPDAPPFTETISDAIQPDLAFLALVVIGGLLALWMFRWWFRGKTRRQVLRLERYRMAQEAAVVAGDLEAAEAYRRKQFEIGEWLTQHGTWSSDQIRAFINKRGLVRMPM